MLERTMWVVKSIETGLYLGRCEEWDDEMSHLYNYEGAARMATEKMVTDGKIHASRDEVWACDLHLFRPERCQVIRVDAKFEEK